MHTSKEPVSSKQDKVRRDPRAVSELPKGKDKERQNQQERSTHYKGVSVGLAANLSSETMGSRVNRVT